MTTTIRPARPADGPTLQAIERLAGEAFRAAGMPDIADDAPDSLDALAEYASDGRSWVAVDSFDTPIGYLLVDLVDECAHIEQVSVLPDHQGSGVGRALIDHVQAWARRQSLAGVTLTTFRDIPWNAPLYRHLGFRELGDHEIGPELREVLAEEAADGLDPTLRVCMRLDLSD